MQIIYLVFFLFAPNSVDFPAFLFGVFYIKCIISLSSASCCHFVLLQTDLQTHVSARDVASCFEKQINPSSHPGTFASPNSKPSPNHAITAVTRHEGQRPEKGTEAVAKPVQLHPDHIQVGLDLYCHFLQ